MKYMIVDPVRENEKALYLRRPKEIYTSIPRVAQVGGEVQVRDSAGMSWWLEKAALVEVKPKRRKTTRATVETKAFKAPTKAQIAELINLWHLSKVVHSKKYDRMIYTSREYAKAHPEVSDTWAYKALERQLAGLYAGNPRKAAPGRKPKGVRGIYTKETIPKKNAPDEREVLRKNQDVIIAYAERHGYSDDMSISDEYVDAPTVGDLRKFIHPKWAGVISSLAAKFKENPKPRTKKNPPSPVRGIRRPRPVTQADCNKAKLIYTDIIEVKASKAGMPHRCDAECKRVNHQYVHRFKVKNACIWGVSGGRFLVGI